MSQHTTLIIGIIGAILAVGVIAGYAVSQNDPSDSSEGISDEEMNNALSGYAEDLNKYGGKICTASADLSVPMGTNVNVSDGSLVFVYSGTTYCVPYTGISYVAVYHS